ncbi:MAG: chemotaxis protein CheA [Oscillospiraceae bacterium]|nr:chemotaxis protein CheA [Oscillospiraceae bacterium]
MSGSANDSMLEMFLFEMSSLIDQLDEILLTSEKNQALTEDDVNEIFRIMHTIKGSSAMMEFDVIAAVTHKLEDTFFYIRENGIEQQFFTPLFDVMLDATDFLKTQLEAIQNGDELSAGNPELEERVLGVLAMLNGTASPGEGAASPPPAEEPGMGGKGPAEEPVPPAEEAPAESADGITHGTPYSAEVFFDEDCGMENLRAFMLVNTLKSTCNIISYDPPDIETNQDSASQILVHGFHLILETELDHDQLQEIIDECMHVKTATVIPVEGGYAQGAGGDSEIGGDRYEIHVRFEEDCSMENLRAFMLINSLRQKCDIVSFSPPDIENNSETAFEIAKNGFDIVLQTPIPQKELQSMFSPAMHVHDALIKKIAAPDKPEPAHEPSSPEAAADSKASAPAAKASAPAPAKAQAAAAKPENGAAQPAHKPAKPNIINVSLSKLDDLMDIMGEIVITESMVTHSPDLKGVADLDNFHKAARQLRKLTDELQDIVMSVRMVPIAGTFQKMHRIVRDMSRALNKEANLVTMGEDTDIDKTIIDGIADPIMHLVRNAMDHGVEAPEVREAAGKNPKATITLSAQNTGGEILITVSDDGKGLDAEKLIAKAKANGILTKPSNEYTEKEAYMLLCAPGFSTKEEVTEFSGRGVGLDVVKKNIEKVGGTVVIESKPGHGMSVFLKIPLTLAIVDGMDVTVGGGLYTIQITSINESFKAAREQIIVDTTGNEMIIIRGDVYPIIRMHQLFAVPNAHTNIEDGILIWVQAGEQSACLFVDELIGEQQIVVKPLPSYLSRYDAKSYGIAGCTILGDGNISLILDVGSIIEKTMEMR